MYGKFKIKSDNGDNFHKISVAQSHDVQNGSEGVFSIYQVRKVGNEYVFGVQGDVTEADNGYDSDDTVAFELDTWYELSLKTYTDGRDGSHETARLYNDETGQKIWQKTTSGGGDSQSYYKVGAYRLTDGYGPVGVTWRQLKFWTGK